MSVGENILRKYGWTQGKQNYFFLSKTHVVLMNKFSNSF